MTATEAPPEPAPAGGPAPEPSGGLAAKRARHALGRILVVLARSVAVFVPVFLVATFVTFALRSLKRDLFRTEYEADTLRGNLGLPVPADRHSGRSSSLNG